MDTHSPQENAPLSNPNPGKNNSMQMWLVPGSILVAGVIIAAAIAFALMYGSNKQAPAVATNTQQPASGAAKAVDIKSVVTANEPFYGNPNAPVSIAYWSDYQCPFCQQFEDGSLQTIVKNYVASGKVKIIFKDFPFLGPDSTTDALYARAIWSLYPHQYFAWRTALFTAQPEENSLSAADNKAHVQKIDASIPGIDPAKVDQAVVSNEAAYTQEINADRDEGTAFGVTGTPSFIIGTQLLSGAPAYSAFDQLISSQLK